MTDTLMGVIIGGLITATVSIIGQVLTNMHAVKIAELKFIQERRLSKISSMEKRVENAIRVAVEYARTAWMARINSSDQTLLLDHLRSWVDSWRVYGELGMYLERKEAEVYLELINEMATIPTDLLINDGSPEKKAEFERAIEPIREKADRLTSHFRKHFDGK